METHAPFASRLFGRRKGRPLRVRKTHLMEELLPQLAISISGKGAILDHRHLFKNESAPLWMEIGFGGGEHLAAQAALHKDINFIGCEPFENGIASLLDHLDRDHIDNVRIFTSDAGLMLDALGDACLEKCFILFADPWPKKRHRERRFINRDNLVRLKRVLKTNALLRMASDHPDLIAWIRQTMESTRGFECLYDDVMPPQEWVVTRYQEKAQTAGRPIVFLDYKKIEKSVSRSIP